MGTNEAADERSIHNPDIPLSAAAIVDYLGPDHATDAGVNVSEQSALSSAAVWAAVQLLSGAVGMLPVHVFRKLQGGGREQLDSHPVAALLDLEANTETTSQLFFESMMVNLLLYGSAFALIDRNAAERPKALTVLPTAQTYIERVNGQTRIINETASGPVTFRPIEVMHIPGLSTNGLIGINPVARGRGAIGVGLAAEQQAGSFYRNGAVMSGVLEYPGKLSGEAAKRLRESWSGMHAGAKNRWRTAVLEEGMKYSSTSIPAADSQMLETRKFQAVEVARIFGVPPSMIFEMDRATWNNAESMGQQFVTYSLNRWLVRIEKEARRKLFRETEKRTHYIKFNTTSLLRGDSAARGEYYAKLSSVGALSPNDIRALEDLNPVPGGDDYRVPLNTTSLAAAEPEQLPAPAEPGEVADIRAAWLVDVIKRLDVMERERVQRAVKKYLFTPATPDVDGFRDWAVVFYGEKLRGMIESNVNAPLGPAGDPAEFAQRLATERLGRVLAAATRADDSGDHVLNLWSVPDD